MEATLTRPIPSLELLADRIVSKEAVKQLKKYIEICSPSEIHDCENDIKEYEFIIDKIERLLKLRGVKYE